MKQKVSISKLSERTITRFNTQIGHYLGGKRIKDNLFEFIGPDGDSLKKELLYHIEPLELQDLYNIVLEHSNGLGFEITKDFSLFNLKYYRIKNKIPILNLSRDNFETKQDQFYFSILVCIFFMVKYERGDVMIPREVNDTNFSEFMDLFEK